jgi:endonuclease VIII
VPEGDTIYRAAAALRTALVGKAISRFEASHLSGPTPGLGASIERVDSHGKHLEIVFDDGIVLHTQMRMTGSWHVYRPGQKWRKRRHLARVIIETQDWVAVAFSTAIVETYRQLDPTYVSQKQIFMNVLHVFFTTTILMQPLLRRCLINEC